MSLHDLYMSLHETMYCKIFAKLGFQIEHDRKDILKQDINIFSTFPRRHAKFHRETPMAWVTFENEVKRNYYSDSFFNPHELAKIFLESSTKFYGFKLEHLAYRTEPKKFNLFPPDIQYRAKLEGPLQFFIEDLRQNG